MQCIVLAGQGKFHSDGDGCKFGGFAGHSGVAAGFRALLAHGQVTRRLLDEH